MAGNLFDDDFNDYFEPEGVPEEKPEVKEETPEEREEREMKELTYDRSHNRKRLYIIIGVVAVVTIFIVMTWMHFFRPYATSQERGVIMKVENRGTLFKTYEVEMIAEKHISDTVRIYSTDFDFTLKDDSLAAAATKLAGTGVRVTVDYKEYAGNLPWRGESNRIVTKIIPDNDPLGDSTK